jgi:hypothetical protein
MQWEAPPWRSLWDEFGEFTRAAKEKNVWLPKLFWLFCTGKLVELDDDTWASLENSDSWETRSLEQVFEAAAAAKPPRDVKRLIEAHRTGNMLPAPMMLVLAGQSHLMSGNTRLMLSAALGERPKVFKLG